MFGSPAEFLQSDIADGPSCLVLDVRLPGVSGLDFQVQLADANILLPVIFITGHGDIPMTVKAMRAGAVEFLTKPFRDQDLLDAVHRALEADRARGIIRPRRPVQDGLGVGGAPAGPGGFGGRGAPPEAPPAAPGGR